MFSSSGASLTVSQLPCRCIAALNGERSNRFAIGTCSLVEENELLVVEYDEDENAITTVAVAQHPGEIWSLAPHPTKQDLVLTCGNTGTEHVGTLFKIDLDLDGETATKARLEEIAQMPRAERKLRHLLWHPVEDDDGRQDDGSERFISVHDGQVQLWDLVGSRLDSIGNYVSKTENQQSYSACWDPHHITQASAAIGTTIETVDLRTMSISRKIEDAHKIAVRSIDYNPNKPYFLVSGGDDRKLKFWDIRKSNMPVKVVVAHDHWVSNVAYNRFHDQLVLSTSTDAMVSLFRISSISSAPLLELEEDFDKENESDGAASRETPSPGNDGSNSETADARVKSFEDHNDSVYGAAWSASEAWVFATISYDGKLVINHVPSAEKYKILL